MRLAELTGTVRLWLCGERFHLRSRLNDDECKRRIAGYGSVGFIQSVTDEPITSLRGNRVRVYPSRPFKQRSPQLVGHLRSTATGTELIGRAGGDFLSLWLVIGIEALFVWALIASGGADPVIWALLLVPILLYFAHRRSPHAEPLIDFLAELLEADNLDDRRGDPFTRR